MMKTYSDPTRTPWKSFLLLCVGVALAAAFPRPAGAVVCPPPVTDFLPQHSISASWDGGDVVSFVDTRRDLLMRYRVGDGFIDSVDLRHEIEPFQPSAIAPTGRHGYALQLQGGRYVTLNDRLRPVGVVEQVNGRLTVEDARGNGPPRTGVVQGVYSWDYAAGSLVLCGDVEWDDSNWATAYLRVGRNFEGATVLYEFGIDDELRTHCRIGHDYVTSHGSTAFVLRMESEPVIYRHARNGESEPLSTDLGTRPDLPVFRTSDDFVEVMRTVTLSSMPVGLYEWRGDLWVLSRRPAGDDSTEWKLTRIDRQSGARLGSVILPSTSDHLTVAPGPTAWALLEKGAVRAIEDQDALALRFIPASELYGLDSEDRPICR